MAAESMDIDETSNPDSPFLDTVEGEISFFRSVMRTRPVGMHRHFHVLAIRNAIHRDTGVWVSADDIWSKLKVYYELEVLENLEIDGYDTPNSKSSSSSQHVVRSPSPSENLSLHPYFREEYTLPADSTIDAIVSARRVRATASLPSSSPAPSPPLKVTRATTAKKKGRGRGGGAGAGGGRKNAMAGLVAGDSDSSALTQESGDEGDGGVAGGEGSTRMGSVATGTDAGTEEQEQEGEDVEDEQGPAKGKKKGKKGAGASTNVRTRRSSVSAAKPPTKKRKR
ncbi:hypothetical protein EUX98_g5917 [Antrodiella citrinella]|uniref:Chromatin modification-related protein EAF7 n=1 Tax=Antrodiella citrinella TaxID=2447956 RepID=A0A4V3XI84_9APHY|nr:hypothetical protein EUX98_g5917 [Antrodiella citrinella]